VQIDDLPEIDVDVASFQVDPLSSFDALRPGWAARSNRGIEVFGYRGVEAVYRNPALVAGVTKLIREMGIDPDEMTGGGANLQGNDGPDHDRLRRIVSRWFTPSSVAALEPRVDELCNTLIAPLTEAGGGEYMTAVARRIPGPVFCWMIGAPDELGDRIFELSEVLLLAFGGDASNTDAIMQAAGGMRELVDGLVDDKRTSPGDDLLSILLDAEKSGEITIDDVHSLMFEMLGASTDNTAHSAGLAASVLGTHPDQWRVIQDEPDILENALEECARFEPRVRCDSAWAPEGAELLGLEVPVDAMVWQHTIGAHMDPDVFPEPHTLDVTRTFAAPQLNFGVGRHFCLGAALARMELRTLYRVMLREWETFEPVSTPVIERDVAGTSVRELTVTCTPRPSAG
jgi:cytochrome P450